MHKLTSSYKDFTSLVEDSAYINSWHNSFIAAISKKELKELAFKDNLTGLYNRNAFDKITDNKKSGYFAIIDIDHFKKFNDTYGHDVGDETLKLVAKVLDEELVAFRWGGEEFVVLIPEDKNVDDYLNAVRELISKIKIPNAPGEKLTVSIGYTDFTDRPIDETFKRADKALYCSKKNGRNMVTKFEEGMECEAHNDNGKELTKKDECDETENVKKNETKDYEIAVDLDGTLLIDRYPEFGEPIKENVEILKALKKKGFKITIFTASYGTKGRSEKEIADYLTKNGIPFDKITNIKPYTATAFIDDRNIEVKYNGVWENIEDSIENILKKHKVKATQLFNQYNITTPPNLNKELDEELDKVLKGIPENMLDEIINKIKDNKMTIPMLKLAFPEIVFNSDLLNKLRE